MSAFDAGGILGSLGLDISGFTGGMLEAQGISELFPQVVTDFLVDPLLAAADVAKEAAEAIVDAVGEIGNSAGNMSLMAEKAGVSIDYFSRMADVAGTVGVSAGELSTAFKFLNKNAAEATEGNKTASDAFSHLGISADFLHENLNNTPAIMQAVISAISAMPTAAERTRASLEILGRQGEAMVPLFNLGGDAIQRLGDQFKAFGAVESEESGKSGRSFLQLEAMGGAAMEGLEKAFADPILDALAGHMQDFLPVITEVSQFLRGEMVEAIGAGKEAWASWLPGLKEVGGPALVLVKEGIQYVVAALKEMAPILSAIGTIFSEDVAPDITRALDIGAGLLKFMTDLLAYTTQATQAFTDFLGLTNSASDSANAFVGGGSGVVGGGAGGSWGDDDKPQVKVDAKITIDPKAASSEVEKKLRPHIERAVEKHRQIVDSVASNARVRRAVGGI